MKKIIIGSVIVILLVLIAGLYLSIPRFTEIKIKKAIATANYCDQDSDCIDAGGKCPFDCWVYVNENEVERISGLIKSFDSKCVYGCVSCPAAICRNNKCEAVCEK